MDLDPLSKCHRTKAKGSRGLPLAPFTWIHIFLSLAHGASLPLLPTHGFLHATSFLDLRRIGRTPPTSLLNLLSELSCFLILIMHPLQSPLQCGSLVKYCPAILEIMSIKGEVLEIGQVLINACILHFCVVPRVQRSIKADIIGFHIAFVLMHLQGFLLL